MTANSEIIEKGLAIVARAYGHYFGDQALGDDQEDWLYIADCETYELKLLINNKGGWFPSSDSLWQGKKCYEVIERRDSPCEKCKMKSIHPDNYYAAICVNEATGTDIFVKDIKINWDGRPCKLQTIIDISSRERRDEVLSEYLLSRNVMTNILCQLMEDKPAESVFSNICKEIGTFFEADRVLITEFYSGQLNAVWTADGEPYEIICEKMSREGIAELTEATRNLRYIWVPDVANAEHIRKDIRDYWLSQGIRSMFMCPMQHNGEFIGTLSLHNFKKHMSEIDMLNLIALSLAKTIYSTIIESTSRLQLYTDPLTGASNLAGLKRRAFELLEKNKEQIYSFCVCDIRYFSGINRRFSYDLGDKILNKTAETFGDMLDQDEAFCRIAADQFCFIAKFDDENSFRDRFDTFVDKMQCFPMLSSMNFKIEYQVGVYLPDRSEQRDISISRAIDKANIARKTLKDFHGSRLAFFDTAMLEESKREMDLIHDFKTALKGDEITVFYQPQCRYTEGKIAGAEALVRWKSPKHGYVSPAEFIPILERNGLIYELDKYVWEMVCRDQQKWMKMGYKCPVSINVSRHDVLREGMCDELCALLEKYGIPKNMIPLEITETAYIKNSNELVTVVSKLKNAGFIVEMDDFGSGYSSLNALKDVAVDLLKLDMKFLDMTSERARGTSILNCVVRMTRWLNLPVLAEGVETREQAEYLKNIGCDLMQGYFFARPMPAAQFEEMLRQEEASDEIPREQQLISAASFMESIVTNPDFFNHIGAAAIVEYCNRECEALLINDRFFKMIDCTREEYMPYMKQMHLYTKAVQHHVNVADIFDGIVNGLNVHDFAFTKKDGTVHKIRLTVRKLLSDIDRDILLLTLDDIP